MPGHRHILALLAALPLAVSWPVWAECECLWQGSFSDVQASANLVVSGSISRGKGNSIDLAVDKVLRGDEDLPEIRVWLKTGDLCRPEPALFPTGSQWVMALQQITDRVPGGFNPNTPNVSYGRVGDYSLSRCGGYWLSQNENLVSGNLTGGPRWVMEPKMSPVLLELVAGYVAGTVDQATLKEAGRVNPELQKLILETRLHLRNQQ